MSTNVVETVHGKHHKYEVVEKTSTFGSPTYYVRCSDGSISGSFDRLDDAVEWAEEKAEKR